MSYIIPDDQKKQLNKLDDNAQMNVVSHLFASRIRKDKVGVLYTMLKELGVSDQKIADRMTAAGYHMTRQNVSITYGKLRPQNGGDK